MKVIEPLWNVKGGQTNKAHAICLGTCTHMQYFPCFPGFGISQAGELLDRGVIERCALSGSLGVDADGTTDGLDRDARPSDEAHDLLLPALRSQLHAYMHTLHASMYIAMYVCVYARTHMCGYACICVRTFTCKYVHVSVYT